MRFSVLGPLVVHGPRGSVDVVGGKERTLLAHLVSAAGRVVTVDELSDSLWGDHPPRAPGKALQTYVLRLRNALEPERRGVPTIVVTEGAGYRLVASEHDVDAHLFAHLVSAGRESLDAGRPAEAAATLREALALWRGPAYAGFEEAAFGRAERQRLDALRVSAREDRWAAEVDFGRSSVAVPELEQLVAEHPWRERAWGVLVLALVRAGRQGEALGALERARARLAEDLGVDPGPQLRDLHAKVLAHDPGLMVLPEESAAAPSEAVVPMVSRAEGLAVVRDESVSVAAARTALRGGRAALVEGIYALQTAGPRRALPPDVCPWRGLETYDVADRPWFAGRERLAAELLARLSSDSLVVVVGASGSGKSSLVRAGMLGALEEGALPGSSGWTTLLMRPGAAPMRELAAVALGAAQSVPTLGDLLLRLADQGDHDDTRQTVLVVDQLEELWTACDDDREREAFLDALVGIAHETDARVVLVVRGDYFARLADHAGIAELARDATLLVGAPSAAEVRRMVEVPAGASGLTLDTGLADTLTDDAGQEPGLLPLLSTSLLQLWERRRDGRLTYADYVSIGGLAGAVAHLAEEAYEQLPEADRAAARVVLLRLAGRAGTGEVVRRRVALAELDGLPGPTRRVAATLAGARLLTLTHDAVEVAHESLFREWPRLAAWLADDVSSRTVQHRLAVAAGQWEAQDRDPGLLWRGAGLQAALDVVTAYPDETTAVERDFLAAGEAVLDAERLEAEQRAEQGERQNRRLRMLVVIGTVLLLVALVAGVLAAVGRQQAAEARDRQAEAAVAADARRLAAASLNEEQLDLALLQAVEAVRTEPGSETHGALLSLLARTPDLLRQRRAETPFLRAHASHDGRVVAVAEFDPRVIGVDADSGKQLWTRDVPGAGHVLTLDASQRGFLVTFWNDAGGTGVELWDDRSGRTMWSLAPGDVEAVVGAGEADLLEAVWLADGRALVLTPTHLVTVSPRGRVRRALALRPGPYPSLLRAWPDGRVSYEAPLDVGHVLDLDRPGRVRTLDFSVPSVSPDGEVVLTADRSQPDLVRLRLRDSRTFEPRGEQMTVSSFDDGVDWAPDGRTFVIGAGETVQVRDRRGRLLRDLTGAHNGAVMAPVVAGADRQVLWSAGRDGLLSAWTLGSTDGLLSSMDLGASPFTGQASLDGLRAVALDVIETDLNQAYLLDGRSGAASDPLPMPSGCQCQPWSVAMSGDGSVALGAVTELGPGGLVEDRGSVAVWDADTGDLLHVVETPWAPVAVAATPDGTRAVVNGLAGVAVVDLRDGTIVGEPLQLERLRAPEGVTRVSADGRSAAVSRDGNLLVLDVDTGTEVAVRPLGSRSATAQRATALGWVADDLVVGGLDGRLLFLDGSTLSPVAPPREVSAGFVIDVVQVGDVVASLGTDGDVRLWDVRTWSPIGLPVTEENVPGFLSGSDGELRAWFEGGSTSRGGRARDLALDPEGWVSRACEIAGRQLSEDEWAVIHPGRAWRETCP
ncbi:BTAD domain-containing putative transcriptional regulator [Microbacterium sp. ARD31]|uniref:nSTAND1 domain-containing NTPase n=1 Tax=Microbacterium sp. ARD31 TaxID=2962576 RepID=UPI00288244E7|nr:BTAD domain-containing putative transcriptional regulator [Microbacterium sp. ARD31]MDT0185638.1 BTAD domain-containing putative transcriptional regulator [Microbacterium sp. ARD31]